MREHFQGRQEQFFSSLKAYVQSSSRSPPVACGQAFGHITLT
jgi:hypothetical protein